MNTDPSEVVRKSAAQQRVIVLVVFITTVVCAAIVIYIQWKKLFNIAGMELITYLGLGLLTSMVALNVVLLPAFDASARKRIDPKSSDPKPWTDAFARRMITGSALIQGGTFLCLIGAMLDGKPIGAIAALAGALMMLLLHFPIEARLQAYIDGQRASAAPEW